MANQLEGGSQNVYPIFKPITRGRITDSATTNCAEFVNRLTFSLVRFWA